MKAIEFKIDSYEMLTYVAREFIKKNVVFVLSGQDAFPFLQLPLVAGDSLIAFYKWGQQAKIKKQLDDGKRVFCDVFYSGAVPPVVRKIEAMTAASYFCEGKCKLHLAANNGTLPFSYGEVKKND